MTLDEFHSLCPIELDAILSVQYKDERERKEWERLNTYILFNAQGSSENIKTPKDLISFPWDEEEKEEELIPIEVDWDEIDKKYRGQ